MTTPIPTGDLVAPAGVAGVLPEGLLPEGLLPDEATLNRLAGEFFAALPGVPAGSGWPTVGSAVGVPVGAGSPASSSVTAGEVEHAPRVDVPATASGVTHAPGSPDADGPGFEQIDPVAASGVSPSGSVPDVTQVSDSITGAAGVGGVPVPETPVVPGVTGLQLAGPGELTPGVAGLSLPLPSAGLPLPSAGLPGIPASDQVVSGAGLPGWSPDPRC